MKLLVAAFLIFAVLGMNLKSAAQPQNPEEKKKSTVRGTAKKQNAGEILFRENCGRCHMPPEAISPREAKAVLRHMRVRAMLSAEDEQALLKFLAP